MTITEAKKIIELCADAVKKTDGEDAKVYVNKEYVLQILDMVDENPHLDWPDIPSFPWNPMSPGVTYTDGHWVWRKISTGTGDDAPGEWHLVYEKGPDPYTPWCNDPNSTSRQPWQPEVHVTCDDTIKFTKYSNDSSMYKDNGVTTTLSSSDKTVDVSPKRTDYIDDFESTATSDLKVKRTDFIEDFVPNGTVSK